MSARAGAGGGAPGAAAAAGGAGGGNGSANRTTTNSPQGVESLAQAIERVWGRRRGFVSGKKAQAEAARDPANWATVWALVTEVNQPMATNGTDYIIRASVMDETLAAATENARRQAAEARARGDGSSGALNPLQGVHWPAGLPLILFAHQCAQQGVVRSLCGGVAPPPPAPPPVGAIVRLTNVVVQGFDGRPQLFAKVGADPNGSSSSSSSSSGSGGQFGIACYPRRDPRDGGPGASDICRPVATTRGAIAVPRAGDGASAARLAALRLMAARMDAELGDPNHAIVRYYGATSVPPSPMAHGGGGGGGGGWGEPMPAPMPMPAPQQQQQQQHRQQQQPHPQPPRLQPPPPPHRQHQAGPPLAPPPGACDPGVFGSGGGGWAAAQQQRVTRRQAVAGAADGAAAAPAAAAAAAAAAVAAAAAPPLSAPPAPPAQAPPPPPAPQGGVASGIAAAVSGVLARARALGGGAAASGGAASGGSTPAATTMAAATAAAAPTTTAADLAPPNQPLNRHPMLPTLEAITLPEADHESPALVDVRARVVAVDTTDPSGLVVAWLWDGTDVAPLPENATCPPAMHQGDPICEPERRVVVVDGAEAAAGGEAADGTTTTTTTTKTTGPVSRPMPLRSAPGVQVLSAPTCLNATDPGGDAAVEQPLLVVAPASAASSSSPLLPPAQLAAAAAAAARRMLTSPKLPPVGSAVPLVILPVMRGSRVHPAGGGGGGGQQGQRGHGPNTTTTTTATTGSLAPRFDTASLPAPGAWVKLRHLALQVAPGGELQLLYGTPSKLSLVAAPGSAGDGAAPHLEARLAERLARGDTAPWASARRGGAVVASLPPEELEKAERRAEVIEGAVKEHAKVVKKAGLWVRGEEGEEGCEDGGDGENAPPPAAAPKRKKSGSTATTPTAAATPTATTTTTTTTTTIPLVTLRQLLSVRQRQRACADALALAARDEADGFAPRSAYYTRAVRAVVRVASLQPTDLVQWALDFDDGRQQQQQRWGLGGRAVLADGTVTAGAAGGASGASSSVPAVVEAFVDPQSSEALLGVDAGPLDGRDARSRDRLARLAASVARLQAVGPAVREQPTRAAAGGDANAEQEEEDADALLLVEPTAWVEALIVPRVSMPDEGAANGGNWGVDYLLTGARLLSEDEVERQRRRGRRGGGGRGGGGEEAAALAAAALSAAVRAAVKAGQEEAARRRAGSSPVAAAGGRRPLPPVEEEEGGQAGGAEAGAGGGAKRRKRG